MTRRHPTARGTVQGDAARGAGPPQVAGRPSSSLLTQPGGTLPTLAIPSPPSGTFPIVLNPAASWSDC